MADAPLPITRFDAHAFQCDENAGAEDAAKDGTCAYCGYPRASIIHHPSRIEATLAIRRRDEEAKAS